MRCQAHVSLSGATRHRGVGTGARGVTHTARSWAACHQTQGNCGTPACGCWSEGQDTRRRRQSSRDRFPQDEIVEPVAVTV